MAGLEQYLRYSNDGATRNKRLDPRLEQSLGFLKDMGIQAEVFSGGQDAEGPRRTGSRRHDHGGAGDFRFYQGDRQLDWANSDDLPIFQQIVTKGKEAGITGMGAGPGYMGSGTMHLGFGKPAVWGAGGKGENAPEWLKAAYNGAKFDPVSEVMAAGGSGPTLARTVAAGVPQGNVAPDAKGIMPPLGAAPDIAAAKPDLGSKIGNAIFGEELAGDLKGMFGAGAPKDGPGASAMGLFKQAMGGGQNAQAQQAAQQITPSSISVDDSAQRMQAGSQLMATLMAGRRKRPGMTMGA